MEEVPQAFGRITLYRALVTRWPSQPNCRLLNVLAFQQENTPDAGRKGVRSFLVPRVALINYLAH